MKSQTKQILEHLKAGEKLTAYQALQKFRCFRLAARIYDIRKKGFDIQSKMVNVGTDKDVAQYFIKKGV